MNTRPRPAGGNGFFERMVAHEMGVPEVGEAPSLRAQLPYAFEAMRGHEPETLLETPAPLTRVSPANAGDESRHTAPAMPPAQPLIVHGDKLDAGVSSRVTAGSVQPARTSAAAEPTRAEHVLREHRLPIASAEHKPLKADAAAPFVPLRLPLLRTAMPEAKKQEPPAARGFHLHGLLPATATPAPFSPRLDATTALRPTSLMSYAPLAPQATASEPVIEIHIGRLEVRAQPSPANTASPSRAPPPKDDRLSEYLARRTRGARS